MAAYTEISVSLTDSNVKTFLEGKENQYSKRKTEMYVLSILAAESENWQLEDLPPADVTVYLKDYFCC